MKSFLQLCCLVILLTTTLFTEIFSQDETGSFEFEGRTREYEVYLPQNFQSNMPLMISLHGYSETVRWYKDYTVMHQIADTAGFIVVYPAGSVASNGIPGWNNGLRDHFLGRTDTTSNDVGYLNVLIDTLYANYGINLSRVYCCGYSMGGEMTYRMAIEVGHRFAAFASVAGKLNDISANSGIPLRPFPILHFHGTNDNIETYDGENDGNLWSVEQSINYWLENNNCVLEPDTLAIPDINNTDGSTVQKISYTNCSDESQIVFYKVLGGGHGWPGSTEGMYPNGIPNRDISASSLIWNFLKNYENPLVNIAFVSSKEVYPRYLSPQEDTLIAIARLINPENHSVTVQAFIEGNQTGYIDSLQLLDDGLNRDGESSDNIYGRQILLSDLEKDYYNVNLRTTDHDTGITTNLNYPSRFTNIGPLKFSSFSFDRNDTTFAPGNQITIKIHIKNWDVTASATNVHVEINSLNPMITFVEGYNSADFDDIAPGESQVSKSIFGCTVSEEATPGVSIYLPITIFSNGYPFWSDTMQVDIIPTAIANNKVNIPREYSLSQNYPNPFNPSTVISWQLAVSSDVDLSIYNLLGQKVATLVSEKQNAGIHQVEWDASQLSSGIYYYRIEAGEFQDVKKMILLR